MSVPTLQGLQTALSGLLAQQQALDVTGNNIANVNTPGYSRETAVLQTNPTINIPALSTLTGEGAQMGTGVNVQTISRIRNVYLDAQYRSQNSALSKASTQADELGRAQAAFNEPSSSSVASQLTAFWNAWGNLANTPTSEAARQAVVATGQQLAQTLNELSTQLSTVAAQANEQYEAVTGPSGEVQDYANQIAQLNGQIKMAQEAGQQPNSMLDRRDQLIDQLSGLAQVTVTEQPNHMDTITFGDAAEPLVEGTTVN
jgi:flagellar hook-associated protein 1